MTRTLTQSEIGRTAFKAVDPKGINSPFGYTHPHRDKNEMCPYCKREDTDVIRDAAELEPFARFYAGKYARFTAVSCPSCSAVWSFYSPEGV